MNLTLRTDDIHLLAPPSGRRDTLVAALEVLHKLALPGETRIVEIGTTRDLRPIACLADGWATRVFAWYIAQVHGRLFVVDTDAFAIACAKEVVGPYLPWMRWRQGTGEGLLADHIDPIDLLYMDGPAAAQPHLDMYRALQVRPRLVLFDDVGPDFGPKGSLAIPAMLEDGYQLVFHEKAQALLRCPA